MANPRFYCDLRMSGKPRYWSCARVYHLAEAKYDRCSEWVTIYTPIAWYPVREYLRDDSESKTHLSVW